MNGTIKTGERHNDFLKGLITRGRGPITTGKGIIF
jgi:hypothetical protein